MTYLKEKKTDSPVNFGGGAAGGIMSMLGGGKKKDAAGNPITFRSPAKDMKTGSYSHSFEMKAKNYNNSPIEKNYGSVEQRFPASAVPYSSNMGGVGSSPAKGWLKKAAGFLNPISQVKRLGKGIKEGNLKSILSGGLLGGGGGAGAGMQEQLAAAAEAAKGAAGAAGGVAPHGDEMHTGGGGAGGEAVMSAAEGMPPEKTNKAAASIAASGAAQAAGGQAAGASMWDMLKRSGAGSVDADPTSVAAMM